MPVNQVTLDITLAADVDPGDFAIMGCKICLAFGKHDLVLLTVRYAQPRNSAISPWPELTPVMLEWGRGGLAAPWYGYVHHVEIGKAMGPGGSPVMITYVLIGASVRFNQSHPRTWQMITDAGIAAAMATAAGFTPIVDATSRIHDALPQNNGVTDWQFLLGRAAEVGYRLWTDGPLFHFADPATLMLPQSGAVVPAYTLDLQRDATTTIDSFEILAGSMVPGAGIKAARTAHVLDPGSGTVVSVATGSGDYLTAYGADFPLMTAADAITALQAADRRANDWLTATAVVRGSTSLKPGALVQITGRAVPAGYGGYWLVTGAEHTLTPNLAGDPSSSIFDTSLALARNTATTYQTTGQTFTPQAQGLLAGFTSGSTRQAWQSNFLLTTAGS